MGKKANRNRDYHPEEQYQDHYNKNELKRKKFHLKDLANIQPKNDRQHDFLEAYLNTDHEVFGLLGCPGTGKTLLAVYGALYDVLDQETPYDKVYIVRSTVETRDRGFLPGTGEDKEAPFADPYVSIMNDVFDIKYSSIYDNLVDLGLLEFRSSSNLRGINLNNCILIIDEFQNQNLQEIETAYDRAGRNTRIIMCGDKAQNDLTKKSSDKSCYDQWIEIMNETGDMLSIEFTKDDIVRNGRIRRKIEAKMRLGLI